MSSFSFSNRNRRFLRPTPKAKDYRIEAWQWITSLPYLTIKQHAWRWGWCELYLLLHAWGLNEPSLSECTLSSLTLIHALMWKNDDQHCCSSLPAFSQVHHQFYNLRIAHQKNLEYQSWQFHYFFITWDNQEVKRCIIVPVDILLGFFFKKNSRSQPKEIDAISGIEP